MTDLSPAAASIVQAFDDRYELLGPMEGNWQELCIAAVLRAAADQVVPEHREHYPNTLDERYRKVSVFDIRNQFLAIAAQLDSTFQQS
jgi:hypothetical protein